MAEDAQNNIHNSTMIKKLLDCAGRDGLVALQGFPIKGEDDCTRFYQDLSLTTYLEVRTKDIAYANEQSSESEPVTVFVKETARIGAVSRVNIDAGTLTSDSSDTTMAEPIHDEGIEHIHFSRTQLDRALQNGRCGLVPIWRLQRVPLGNPAQGLYTTQVVIVGFTRRCIF